MLELTEVEWDNIIDTSKIPVIVEFWAPWCQFCKQFNPIFERVSADYNGIVFARVNVDEQSGIAKKLGVLTIPLLKVFYNSRSILEISGTHSEDELRRFFDETIRRVDLIASSSSIFVNPKIGELDEQEILMKSRTIAFVGISRHPDKDSNSVALYIKSRGFRIIPINPNATEILGERAYPSLLDIPAEIACTIDIVDIFRPSDQVPQIVEQAIQLRDRCKANPKAVWMQLGIQNPSAATKARAAGLLVMQNMCIGIEHRKMTIQQAKK
jgi:predicted CoA-binding protein